MKKQVGNSIRMEWTILRNGQAEDFSLAQDIKIVAFIPNLSSDKIEVPISRLNNVFHIDIEGDLLSIGKYTLHLTYKVPNPAYESGFEMVSTAVKDAFQILTLGSLESSLEDDINITSNVIYCLDGATFIPTLTESATEVVISWTNNRGLPNPDPVNIRGTDGKSAFEIWKEFTGQPTATEQDFFDYLQEPATAAADLAIAAANLANSAATAANTAALAANDAADDASAAATSATSAASAANTAATNAQNVADTYATTLANKIDKTAVKQVTGTSTIDLMSQKAVTDGLMTKSDKHSTANGNILFAGALGALLGDNNLFWDNINKYLGLGTNVPSAQITQKSTAALESAQLGSELLTSSGWTSVGWTGDYATGFTHTAGNTSILSVLPTLVLNNLYQIGVTISNRTAGSVLFRMGGSVDSEAQTSNGVKTYGVKVSNITSPLEIVPTTDFNGSVIVSVKQVTGTYGAIYRLLNAAGSTLVEIRSSSNNTNHFIGRDSGRYLLNGSNNTANGYQSLYNLLNGSANTANGYAALYSILNGSNNTANGSASLYSILNGSNNTANGTASLLSLLNGSNNTANGYGALYNILNGSNHTANGYTALYSIGRTVTAGSFITGLQYVIVTIGTTDFTTIGATSNTLGLTFTATGVGSGTGTAGHVSSGNTAEGYYAGRYLTNGSSPLNAAIDSIYIGNNAKAKADGAIKEIVIGSNATGNGSNTATIGGSTNKGTFFKSVYAELYAADNITAQSVPNGATYTKINQFTTVGQTNSDFVTVSTANDNLTVLKAGRYKIEATASTKSATANIILKTAIFVNGTKAANIQAERRVATANDTSLISIGGIVSLSANDVVDVRVAHDFATSVNITCTHCNLNLIYISE